jgi:hypothetical protein
MVRITTEPQQGDAVLGVDVADFPVEFLCSSKLIVFHE